MSALPVNEEQWRRELSECLHCIFNKNECAEECSKPIIMQFFDTLELVYRFGLRKAKIRDNWIVLYDELPFGQNVWFSSKRFLCEFRFGVHLDKIYTEVPLQHADCLRYMKDNFWSSLVNLHDFGEFQFKSFTEPAFNGQTDAKNLAKYKASAVFNMCRNYVLLYNADGEQEGMQDFGCLHVSWSYDIPLNELCDNLTNVIRLYYRINQMLYRPFYQKQIKYLKKEFSELTPQQQSAYGEFEGFLSLLRESEWRGRWASNPIRETQ